MATYSYTKYIDDDRLGLEVRNSGITIALTSIDITGEDTFDITFKADLQVADKERLDDLVAAHINIPLVVRDSVELAGVDITSNAEKAMKVAQTKLEGSSTQKISHDFCDDTTWFHDSLRVNETLTSSDKLTFKATKAVWIDLEHGKVPYEDRLAINYAPIIKVDGAKVTTGFTINYKLGEVIFESAQEGVVSADFSHANGSTWVMTPSADKILKILGTKIVFTSDVAIAAGQSINFQLFVGGNPYGEATVYKNVKDLIKCSMSTPSTMKGFGDVTGDVNFLPFDYITSKDIKSSLGMEIRIWINDHKSFEGEFGIVTANCLSI